MAKPKRLYYDLDGAVEYLKDAGIFIREADLMHFGETRQISFVRLSDTDEIIELYPDGYNHLTVGENRHQLTELITNAWAIPLGFDSIKIINSHECCWSDKIIYEYYILDSQGIYEQRIKDLDVTGRILHLIGDCTYTHGVTTSMYNYDISTKKIYKNDLFILTSELDLFIKSQAEPETTPTNEVPKGSHLAVIWGLKQMLLTGQDGNGNPIKQANVNQDTIRQALETFEDQHIARTGFGKRTIDDVFSEANRYIENRTK